MESVAQSLNVTELQHSQKDQKHAEAKTWITSQSANNSQPHLVFISKRNLPSILKDSVPTTQNSLVVYKYSCQYEARYVGCTSQQLCDRM